MTQVKHTRDYSLFYYIKGNRPLGPRVKKMMRAIKRKNLLKDYPILVTKQDKKNMRGIWDGQTRFEAAKRLKLEVFFIESDDVSGIEDVSHANAAQSAWSPRDYIHSFAEQGNAEYVKLRDFMTEFGLPASTATALLAGIKATGGTSLHSVKEGTFKVRNETKARQVAGFIQQLKVTIPYATDRPLAQAIVYLMQIKEFSSERLVRKIRNNPQRFTKCVSSEQYIDLIEDLYNYRVRPAELMSLSVEVRRMMARSRREEMEDSE